MLRTVALALLLAVASCSPAPTPVAQPAASASAAMPPPSLPLEQGDAGADAAPLAPEGLFVTKVRAGVTMSMDDLARDCPSSSAAELAGAIPTLSSAGKMTAIICLGRHAGAGRTLLALTKDNDTSVRSMAANLLSRISEPAIADDILRAIPAAAVPHVRGRLYLAAGQSLSPARIEELRALAKAETAPPSSSWMSSPSNSALVALVKLGGQPERAAFIAEIRSTRNNDEIRWIVEVLVEYLKDPSLARPLSAWLTNEANADTSHNPTFRVCDLAAWTAQELGIKVPIDRGAGLRKYSPATLARVRVILDALPQR